MKKHEGKLNRNTVPSHRTSCSYSQYTCLIFDRYTTKSPRPLYILTHNSLCLQQPLQRCNKRIQRLVSLHYYFKIAVVIIVLCIVAPYCCSLFLYLSKVYPLHPNYYTVSILKPILFFWWTKIGRSYTQHDNHNRDFKINSAMILTSVFVYCNAATVAVNINNCVLICTNDVVMSWCIGRK